MQVIVDNMDALLDEPPFSAVAAMPYSSRLFNSGVFVFEPSLAVASALAALNNDRVRAHLNRFHRVAFRANRRNTDDARSL